MMENWSEGKKEEAGGKQRKMLRFENWGNVELE